MSRRMNWDRVNREKRAARSASANTAGASEILPSSVSPLEWDAARWNRHRSDGWTSRELVPRAPGKRFRRKAARKRSNTPPHGDNSRKAKSPVTHSGRGRNLPAWADHRGVTLHGSEFSWTISCGCGKRLGKQGIRKLQDLFGCYRSHFDSTSREALAPHRPYVTDGQEMLLLNCSCEQMTTEFTDLSQAAFRWLQHAAAVAAQSRI